MPVFERGQRGGAGQSWGRWGGCGGCGGRAGGLPRAPAWAALPQCPGASQGTLGLLARFKCRDLLRNRGGTEVPVVRGCNWEGDLCERRPCEPGAGQAHLRPLNTQSVPLVLHKALPDPAILGSPFP